MHLLRYKNWIWRADTFPSRLKYFSSSLLVTLVDKPVTYKLFPGLPASAESRLLSNGIQWWQLYTKTMKAVTPSILLLSFGRSILEHRVSWIKWPVHIVQLPTMWLSYLERLLLDLDNDLDRRSLTRDWE